MMSEGIVIKIPMQLIIQDIINTPELRTRLVCGEQGISNIVQWAHVCEMDDPTEWLGHHDLLMTTGLAIPKDVEKQKEYILRLVNANIAGLMIGENMNAPADLSVLYEVAEQHNFPILMTHYGVPFAAVTKMIMNSRHKFEFDRNRSIASFYEQARNGLNGLETQVLIQKLNKILNAQIYLIDLKTNLSIFGKTSFLPHNILAKLLESNNQSFSKYSLVKKIKFNEFEYLYLLDTSFYDLKLLIHGPKLDFSFIHHISAILSIDLERKNFEFQRKLRMGGELVDDILDKRITTYQLEKQLNQYGITVKKAHLMLVNIKEYVNFESFFFLKNLSIIIKKQFNEYIFIINQSDIELILDIIDKGGVSNQIEYVERFPAAIQEAKLAYKHSDGDKLLQYYSNIVNILPWLPKDVDEAKQIFDRYLGELEKQDCLQGTFHLKTLKIFLDHNCSWEKSAKALHIHKQTLVYRIQKIQTITGRNLNKTEDISIFWFALKCQEVFK